MKVRAVFGLALLPLLICATGARPPAQARPHRARKSSDVASIRHFVQSFYDWYTSLPERADARLLTIKDKGSLLSPTVRRALWDDWYRQELHPGFLTGLDFVYVLNSQDPNKRYKAGRVRQSGNRWFVTMNGVKDAEYSYSVSVTPELAKTSHGWEITNFHYYDEGRHDDLLSGLAANRADEVPWLNVAPHDTPLLKALKTGERDKALKLINTDSVNKPDAKGNTPLHVAAFQCYSDVCQALISAGAQVDAKNKDGEAPLLLAVQNCRDPYMEKVARKIDPQIANEMTARDPLKTATLLIAHGADVNWQRSGFVDQKETPLITAAKFGDEPAVAELLLKGGARINDKDAFGDTALSFAADNTHPNILQVLIQHGADVKAPNSLDERALDSAEDDADYTGDPRPAEIIKMLKAAGALHGKGK